MRKVPREGQGEIYQSSAVSFSQAESRSAGSSSSSVVGFGWDEAGWRRLVARVLPVTKQWRLPLRTRVWRGAAGNWAGAGVGSSVDFQDHRSYVPGDDPRYINWQAYARTGLYTMKLFREEVNPTVDVVYDASASMSFDSAKRDRGLELLVFGVTSALQHGASVRVFVVNGRAVHPCTHEDVMNGRFPHMKDGVSGEPWDATRLPLRSGSLRVVISDLLFPDAPEVVLAPLAAARGRAVVWAPTCLAEREPDWDGNIEFLDCERDVKRPQRVDGALLKKYHSAYRRHTDGWKVQARRYGIALAFVPAEGTLQEAFMREAVPVEAVELWG